MESELPNYDEERKKHLMKHFADLEQMRRLSDKNRRAYNAREQMQEKELEEKVITIIVSSTNDNDMRFVLDE